MSSNQAPGSSALEQVLEHFNGPANLARVLTESGARISSQAISQWKRIPALRAVQIEQVSGGRVKARDLNPEAAPLTTAA